MHVGLMVSSALGRSDKIPPLATGMFILAVDSDAATANTGLPVTENTDSPIFGWRKSAIGVFGATFGVICSRSALNALRRLFCSKGVRNFDLEKENPVKTSLRINSLLYLGICWLIGVIFFLPTRGCKSPLEELTVLWTLLTERLRRRWLIAALRGPTFSPDPSRCLDEARRPSVEYPSSIELPRDESAGDRWGKEISLIVLAFNWRISFRVIFITCDGVSERILLNLSWNLARNAACSSSRSSR